MLALLHSTRSNASAGPDRRVVMTARPLTGRHVVTTRDQPGRLDSLLARLGADVIHVPLIAIEPPADEGRALRRILADIGQVAWLVVTSQHGARAVGLAAAAHPDVRLAAVGARTASVLSALAGRDVDVVPTRQTAADLVATMPTGSGRVVVAQADRADSTLADGLADLGFDVDVVTAYRTVLRAPTPVERIAALGADAVGFASGSAAQAWTETIGVETAPVTVAIGPTTAEVARACGLKVTHVATDHDVEGLAHAIAAALA